MIISQSRVSCGRRAYEKAVGPDSDIDCLPFAYSLCPRRSGGWRPVRCHAGVGGREVCLFCWRMRERPHCGAMERAGMVRRTTPAFSRKPLAKRVGSCYNRHEKQKCGSLRMRQHPQACTGAETTYTTARIGRTAWILYDDSAPHARGGFAVFAPCLCRIKSVRSLRRVGPHPARRFCFSPNLRGRKPLGGCGETSTWEESAQ